MEKEVLFSCLSGLAMTLGAAALDSDNPTYQSDAIKANDWLIVGEPYATFTPGDGSLSVSGMATGLYSLAVGAIASGNGSFAVGYSHASGSSSAALNQSTASGFASFAAGYHAHAKGESSTAFGNWALAAGYNSLAIGDHVESYGKNTVVFGEFNNVGNVVTPITDEYADHPDGHLFVIGNGTAYNARSNALVVLRNGTVQIPSGNLQLGSESALTPSGATTLISNHLSTNGYLKKANGVGSVTSNGGLIALGNGSQADGVDAVAFGINAQAQGQSAIAMNGIAKGSYSVALAGGVADGNRAFAFGLDAYAGDVQTTAIGASSTATAINATAVGTHSYATGVWSTAFGSGLASGEGSVAFGQGIHAAGYAEFVLGRYNIMQANPNTLLIQTDNAFVVGNGEGYANRSNAITTLKNGRTTLTNKFWLANTVTGNEVTASNGEALNVEGHAKIQGDTVLEGKVTLAQPQGDISMGIYN